MSTWSPTYQQSVFMRYHSDKHFSEFLPTRWRQKSTGIHVEQNHVTVTLCISTSCNWVHLYVLLYEGKCKWSYGPSCPVVFSIEIYIHSLAAGQFGSFALNKPSVLSDYSGQRAPVGFVAYSHRLASRLLLLTGWITVGLYQQLLLLLLLLMMQVHDDDWMRHSVMLYV